MSADSNRPCSPCCPRRHKRVSDLTGGLTPYSVSIFCQRSQKTVMAAATETIPTVGGETSVLL